LLYVDGWNVLDIFIYQFVPSPPGATDDGAQKYVQIADDGWKNVHPAVPFSLMFPGADCKFYNTILPNGCPTKIKEYIINSYGHEALSGPTKFSYGGNAGYDDRKRILIMLRKKGEIFLFFKLCFFWALLIFIIFALFKSKKNKCYNSSVEKEIRRIVLLALALPILFAIAWMVYLSKTEPYMLDVNYGNVLYNMLFGLI
jgi:hypothetical protein